MPRAVRTGAAHAQPPHQRGDRWGRGAWPAHGGRSPAGRGPGSGHLHRL